MTQPPKYVVSPVDFDKDWDSLFATYWTAWKTPLQAFGQLTFVGIGTGGQTEESAYEAAKRHYLAEARSNTSQGWVKVEDLEREKQGLDAIVGGGIWSVYGENPFRVHKEGPVDIIGMKLSGPDFEPGSERYRLRRELYAQMGSWRPKLMTTAHVYGQGLWSIPEYRHKGAAEALLDFWVGLIDGLGVEAYLEASSLVASVYLKFGFTIIEYPTLTFQREDPSPDWANLVRDMQSHPIGIMWRPKGGKYVEGETVMPWLGRARDYKL